MTTVAAFDTTAQKTQVWLKELRDIGHFDDESQSYTALRAVLHSLRDRLTVDEAAHLGAQLPMLVRGFYYEGWKPALAPNKERNLQAFLDSVQESLRGNRTTDPLRATEATFKLLDAKVSEGEIEDIKRMIPPDVRDLWP